MATLGGQRPLYLISTSFTSTEFDLSLHSENTTLCRKLSVASTMKHSQPGGQCKLIKAKLPLAVYENYRAITLNYSVAYTIAQTHENVFAFSANVNTTHIHMHVRMHSAALHISHAVS
jgi:hypothetical protein